LLTQQEPKDKKSLVPKELIADLHPITIDFFQDYIWSKRFGRKAKEEGIIWKYNNPWLYPKAEFEMLKTMIIIEDVIVLNAQQLAKNAKADIAAALKVSEAQKEQNKKLSTSMADFFKGPLI
jgi:hypothetical protein